jgi:hypothetical protein
MEGEPLARIYEAERRLLIDATFDQYRLFDRAISTLAAAALGLSLAFIKDVTAGHPVCVEAAVIAWIALCSSLLATLSSFQTSAKAFESSRENLDSGYSKGDLTLAHSLPNKWSTVTTALNWFALGLFICGIASLVYFVAINLGQ